MGRDPQDGHRRHTRRIAGETVAATLTPRTSVRAKVMRSAAATVAAADQRDASDAVSAAGFRIAEA